MKQTDIIKKFKAYEMIKKGYKIREISRILKLSPATISRIKKNNSFFEYNKEAYKIYIYFEKNPFLNLKDLSKIFKMPVSTIYWTKHFVFASPPLNSLFCLSELFLYEFID